jgi:transcriptional regulator with XRE-family HTH domain
VIVAYHLVICNREVMISPLRKRHASLTERGMITPAQLRGARAMLEWTREDLAEQSGIAAVTIRGFEHGRTDPKVSTLFKLKRAAEAGGIEFVDAADGKGPGVRLKKDERGKR